MKKTLFAFCLLFSSFVGYSQSILKMGCGEYGRYPINAVDSFVYEDYWNGQNVQLTKTNTQGEKMIDIAGALYNAVGVSSTGNAWVFGQGNINPVKILTDSTGAPFTGNTACAGYFGTYITVRKGSLWYWGSDDMKFFGKAISKPMALKMPAGVTFTRVRMGNVILALANNGDLWQYDLGNQTPHKVALPGPATDFAPSHTGFYIAIVNGEPWGWGFEYSYMGLTSQPAAPVNLKTVWGLSAPIVRITANHNTIHFIDNQGRLFGMGDNAMGEVGFGQELVNRAEVYHMPQYPQARPYAWSWILHGWMITKPVQIGPAGVKFVDIWADESYAFYHYAKDANGNIYAWGRGKSWVMGHDWSPNDLLPNAYDILSPTIINLFSPGANVNMFTFTPGKISAGPDHQVIGTIDTLSATATASTSYKITSWSWTQLAGKTCNILFPGQPKTPISGLLAGNYTFQVMVMDNNGATVTDTVNLSVTIPNIPPIAAISPVDTITLPMDSLVLDATASHDPDGNIVSYNWAQLSGAMPTVDNVLASKLQLSRLQAGTYIFQVRVTDNMGLTGAATIAFVVKPKPKIIRVETVQNPDGIQVNVYYSDGRIVVLQ